MPQMGVSVAEGTIVAWRVAVGDPIEAEQTLLRDLDRQDRLRGAAPASGTLAEILVEPDTTVDVGTVLGADRRRGATPRPAPDAGHGGALRAGAGCAYRRHRPRLRHVARPALLPGRAADRRRARHRPRRGDRHRPRRPRAQAGRAGARHGGSTGHAEPPMHIESPYRPDPDVPPAADATAPADGLSRMRRTIGQRMKQSLETAATCTTWIEVDMSRVRRPARSSGSRRWRSSPRATVQSLREFPALNAWLNGDDVRPGRRRQPRDRRVARRGRADRAGDPQRARAVRRGAGGADPGPRQARAGRRADRRRRARRARSRSPTRVSTARSWRRR